MKKLISLAGMAALLAACQTANPGAPAILTDQHSAELHDDALLQALESLPDMNSLHWENQDDRTEGYTVPLGTYRLVDGTYCRDYYTKAIVEGVHQFSSGTACRREDGSWAIDRKL